MVYDQLTDHLTISQPYKVNDVTLRRADRPPHFILSQSTNSTRGMKCHVLVDVVKRNALR